MGIGAPKDLSNCRGFFLEPANAKHRMYEALRAYFVEGRPSAEVARDFNYSPGSFKSCAITFAAIPTPSSLCPHARGPALSPRSPPLEISSYDCANRITPSTKSARL
jgi:hypothetical protein